MKISLTYLPKEAQEANRTFDLLQKRFPKSRIHLKESNPPYKTIYLTVKPHKIT